MARTLCFPDHYPPHPQTHWLLPIRLSAFYITVNHKFTKVQKTTTFSCCPLNLYFFSNIFPDGVYTLAARKVHFFDSYSRKNFSFIYRESSQLIASSCPCLQNPSWNSSRGHTLPRKSPASLAGLPGPSHFCPTWNSSNGC